MSKPITSSPTQKNNDISSNTILVSIENNIQLLLNAITVRSHKNLLNDILNSTLLLSKRLEATLLLDSNNHSTKAHKTKKDPSSQNNTDQLPFVPEGKEEELNNLKEEVKDLKQVIQGNEAKIKSIERDKTSIAEDLAEQHKTNNQLNEEKKTLETCLKQLNDEYDKLSIEYERVLLSIKTKDKTVNDLKAQVTLSKKAIDNITLINNNLKDKIVNVEMESKLKIDELTISNKKNNSVRKRLETAETLNKQLKIELNEKEEKQKILKQMNHKLESKSSLILKETNGYVNIVKRIKDYIQQIDDMGNNIKQLNKDLFEQREENEKIVKSKKELLKEKEKADQEVKKLSAENEELQAKNDELLTKKNEIEQRLKVNLRMGDHITICNNTNNNSKKAYSRADTVQSKMNNANGSVKNQAI